MATQISLWIKQPNGMALKGGSQFIGFENCIDILEIQHNITTDYQDHKNGLRQHAPLQMLKPIDSSSPYLNHCCCQGIELPEMDIKIFRSSPTGELEPYYRYRLQRARINAIQPHFDLQKPDTERLWLSYQKIIWLYTEGHIEAEDECW